MITKMKKFTFLVFYKEYEQFLEQLRSLGVVHVSEQAQGTVQDAALQERIQLLTRCNTVLAELEPFAKAAEGAATPSADAVEKAKGLLADYEAILSEKTVAEQRLVALGKDEQTLMPWGDFDPQQITKLAEAGYQLRFFACAPKAYKKEWESAYGALVIDETKQKTHFVVVTRPDASVDIEAEACVLPQTSLSAIAEETQAVQQQLTSYNDRLAAFAADAVPVLAQAQDVLNDEVDFARVRLSGEATCADKLILLQGWAPAADTEAICEELDKDGHFYEVENPTNEDNIPIQLSNNKFAKLFEPLTKLYMLPQYNELDLTLFFAPFFMLFFGLCLGDMGYGLLMIVALPIFTKLFKLINPDFSKWLVILFGASTILCGTLSGSFFGFSLYDLDIPFVQKMKEFLYTDNSTMFTVSLCIGVVQILFGMVLKAVNLAIQCGFKYALSTIGWFVLLVTIIVAVLTGVGMQNPIVIGFIVLGAIGILFFQSPGKNPLLNVGLALWDAYNMATGLLGDVLSYVRLFALGLSGGILANVFNSMAVGMSPKTPVVGFLVTALIFCIGHALNIFMNILGAVVHPMRLTFVEFFKNAGYTGGGEEYKPFRKNAA